MTVLPHAVLLSLAGILLAASSFGTVGAAAAGEPGAAGDIPDTQAFVRYTAREGYSVVVPEGWSRTVSGTSTTFVSHYDGVRIAILRIAPPADALRELGVAVSNLKTASVTIAGRRATLLTFASASKRDEVTGKSVRLDDQAYVFRQRDRQAVLLVWAPHGADNADQWRKIAESFRW